MPDPGGDQARLRIGGLEALTQQFARMEQRQLDEVRTAGLDALADQFARIDRQADAAGPARPPRGRARLRTAGVLVAVAVIVLVAQIWAPRSPRALANPSEGAAAALNAGSFTFQTHSVLEANGRPVRQLSSSGAVDVQRGQEAFRERFVDGSVGSGFERRVFPDAVYVRAITAHGPTGWSGAHLRPYAVLTPYSFGAGGLGDPLKLLAALAKSHRATRLSLERVTGLLARHYRVKMTLGAFLPAHAHASHAERIDAVTVDVWQQESTQRVVRAIRLFELGGRRDLRLRVETTLGDYRHAPPIVRPPVGPEGTQRLNELADDPLGANALDALKAAKAHVVRAVILHSAQHRSAPARTPRR